MDEERAVRLDHEESYGLGQRRGQAAGVEDLAAGDEETHGRPTVLSVRFGRASPNRG